jgi:hypothetical protein
MAIQENISISGQICVGNSNGYDLLDHSKPEIECHSIFG